MRLIVKRMLLMLLLLSVGNVLTGGFQLSAQEQSKRFSVKVDNITLKEAIEVIKKQGNYSFLIRNNDIDLNRKVSVNINNGTINDVMGQLLAGTDVSYEVNARSLRKSALEGIVLPLVKDLSLLLYYCFPFIVFTI